MTEVENKKIVDHWVDLLYLKNYLATYNSSELCEVFSDFELLQSFLRDANSLCNEEPSFLLLNDEFIEKISCMANYYRFQSQEQSSVVLSNTIIRNLNSLLWMSNYIKQINISNYLLFQEEYRRKQIHSIDQLIKITANDAIVFTGIEDGLQYLPNEDILSSLNYFTCVCPECFLDDEFYSHSITFLNSCCDIPFYRKLGKEYRYAIDTKTLVKNARKS